MITVELYHSIEPWAHDFARYCDLGIPNKMAPSIDRTVEPDDQFRSGRDHLCVLCLIVSLVNEAPIIRFSILTPHTDIISMIECLTSDDLLLLYDVVFE